MGFSICLITTLANVCAHMLKRCICDRGYNSKMRSMVIYWMCCLRVSDPFDQSKSNMKKQRQNRNQLKADKKQSMNFEMRYLVESNKNQEVAGQ